MAYMYRAGERWPSANMRRAALFLVVAVAGLGAGGAVPAAWPTFRGDNARSGRASPPISDQPRVLWRAELGGSVDGSPVIADGRVFVGTSEGTLAALEAASGKRLWRCQLEGAICSAAAVAEGCLVVGTARGFLYCFGLDGQLRWRLHAWDAIVASPLVEGGVCVWGSMDGLLHATRLRDGTVLWERELAGGVSAAAAGAGETVYVGDEGGTVWALGREDGKVRWKRETGCPVMAAAVLAGDTLLVPLVSPTRLAPPKIPYLLALDPGSGAVRWQLVEARSVFATPLVGPVGAIYISVEGYLSETFLRCQAFDGSQQLWQQRLGGVVDSSPVLAGERLYFGAHDGCLYIAHSATGAVLARIQLAHKIYSSPAVDEGRLYIGADDGFLYCLQ
jgi:outer membrane protein assembly factor BamB